MFGKELSVVYVSMFDLDHCIQKLQNHPLNVSLSFCVLVTQARYYELENTCMILQDIFNCGDMQDFPDDALRYI